MIDEYSLEGFEEWLEDVGRGLPEYVRVEAKKVARIIGPQLGVPKAGLTGEEEPRGLLLVWDVGEHHVEYEWPGLEDSLAETFYCRHTDPPTYTAEPVEVVRAIEAIGR